MPVGRCRRPEPIAPWRAARHAIPRVLALALLTLFATAVGCEKDDTRQRETNRSFRTFQTPLGEVTAYPDINNLTVAITNQRTAVDDNGDGFGDRLFVGVFFFRSFTQAVDNPRNAPIVSVLGDGELVFTLRRRQRTREAPQGEMVPVHTWKIPVERYKDGVDNVLTGLQTRIALNLPTDQKWRGSAELLTQFLTADNRVLMGEPKRVELTPRANNFAVGQ